MKEGWLWLSILKTTASPSPMSTTPAFSPGPWITWAPLVGSVLSHTRDDLYEQCSLHITEKMPSSVSEGSRPRICKSRWYSSGDRPCSATIWGVMGGCMSCMWGGLARKRFRQHAAYSGPRRRSPPWRGSVLAQGWRHVHILRAVPCEPGGPATFFLRRLAFSDFRNPRPLIG